MSINIIKPAPEPEVRGASDVCEEYTAVPTNCRQVNEVIGGPPQGVPEVVPTADNPDYRLHYFVLYGVGAETQMTSLYDHRDDIVVPSMFVTAVIETHASISAVSAAAATSKIVRLKINSGLDIGPFLVPDHSRIREVLSVENVLVDQLDRSVASETGSHSQSELINVIRDTLVEQEGMTGPSFLSVGLQLTVPAVPPLVMRTADVVNISNFDIWSWYLSL